MLSFLLTGLLSSNIISPTVASAATHNACRFSPQYTTEEIIHYPDNFISDIFFWEGGYHQSEVAYNIHNGVTYDHAILDPRTGLVAENSGWSNPRNEVSRNRLNDRF